MVPGFGVSGLGIRGLSDLLERWIRKPHPRNESSKYAPTESFWGLNKKPSTSCHWFLCFGTRPRHQTRAPRLGPPRLKNAESNFFKNRNILHTLKNEQLNIMLLHTSGTMGGPWIKTVPVVTRIFDVSSSTGLGIEGYLICSKDELGNHTLGTKAQNMHQLRVFWG